MHQRVKLRWQALIPLASGCRKPFAGYLRFATPGVAAASRAFRTGSESALSPPENACAGGAFPRTLEPARSR